MDEQSFMKQRSLCTTIFNILVIRTRGRLPFRLLGIRTVLMNPGWILKIPWIPEVEIDRFWEIKLDVKWYFIGAFIASYPSAAHIKVF